VSIADTVVQVYFLYIGQVAQIVMTGHKRYREMSNKLNHNIDLNQPVVYQIRIKGQLDSQWADWFAGLTIILEEDGNSLLTGPVVDQAALHGLLKKVRDLGLPLVSVSPVVPSPSDTLGTGQADMSDVKK